MLDFVQPQPKAVKEDEVGAPWSVVDEGNALVEATQVIPRRVKQFANTPETDAVDQGQENEQFDEDGASSSPVDPVVIDVISEGVEPGQQVGRQLVENVQVMSHGDPDEEQTERVESLSLPPETFTVDDQVFEGVC